MSDYTLTLVLALIGFFLAYHIWHKKKNKEKLHCFLGKDCSKVIESKHSKHFGIENTVIGILYYIFVVITSLAAILFPVVLTFSIFSTGFIIIAGIAALFSFYLAGVQLFVLKELCEYCIASTLIAIIILIVSLVL
ncbi:MAG: vitamin K epoxide reductase family protein [Nanoarchaeota archaeon]